MISAIKSAFHWPVRFCKKLDNTVDHFSNFWEVANIGMSSAANSIAARNNEEYNNNNNNDNVNVVVGNVDRHVGFVSRIVNGVPSVSTQEVSARSPPLERLRNNRYDRNYDVLSSNTYAALPVLDGPSEDEEKSEQAKIVHAKMEAASRNEVLAPSNSGTSKVPEIIDAVTPDRNNYLRVSCRHKGNVGPYLLRKDKIKGSSQEMEYSSATITCHCGTTGMMLQCYNGFWLELYAYGKSSSNPNLDVLPRHCVYKDDNLDAAATYAKYAERNNGYLKHWCPDKVKIDLMNMIGKPNLKQKFPISKGQVDLNEVDKFRGIREQFSKSDHKHFDPKPDFVATGDKWTKITTTAIKVLQLLFFNNKKLKRKVDFLAQFVDVLKEVTHTGADILSPVQCTCGASCNKDLFTNIWRCSTSSNACQLYQYIGDKCQKLKRQYKYGVKVIDQDELDELDYEQQKYAYPLEYFVAASEQVADETYLSQMLNLPKDHPYIMMVAGLGISTALVVALYNLLKKTDVEEGCCDGCDQPDPKTEKLLEEIKDPVIIDPVAWNLMSKESRIKYLREMKKKIQLPQTKRNKDAKWKYRIKWISGDTVFDDREDDRHYEWENDHDEIDDALEWIADDYLGYHDAENGMSKSERRMGRRMGTVEVKQKKQSVLPTAEVVVQPKRKRIRGKKNKQVKQAANSVKVATCVVLGHDVGPCDKDVDGYHIPACKYFPKEKKEMPQKPQNLPVSGCSKCGGKVNGSFKDCKNCYWQEARPCQNEGCRKKIMTKNPSAKMCAACHYGKKNATVERKAPVAAANDNRWEQSGIDYETTFLKQPIPQKPQGFGVEPAFHYTEWSKYFIPVFDSSYQFLHHGFRFGAYIIVLDHINVVDVYINGHLINLQDPSVKHFDVTKVRIENGGFYAVPTLFVGIGDTMSTKGLRIISGAVSGKARYFSPAKFCDGPFGGANCYTCSTSPGDCGGLVLQVPSSNVPFAAVGIHISSNDLNQQARCMYLPLVAIQRLLNLN